VGNLINPASDPMKTSPPPRTRPTSAPRANGFIGGGVWTQPNVTSGRPPRLPGHRRASGQPTL